MSHRLIYLNIKKQDQELFNSLVKDEVIKDYWLTEKSEDRLHYNILIKTGDTQKITDKIQTFFYDNLVAEAVGVERLEKTKVVILPVEAVMPDITKEEEKKPKSKNSTISREELYDEISKGAELDGNFILFVFLSTIVAAIGLLENNVAVIIGAMVIAPFLGPNLALALATALGDTKLMLKSLKTNLVGLSITLVMAYLLGKFWTGPLDGHELLSRTHVGYDGIILAIASGAAAVLSLVTGLSSVLVGVMVAVALLPPAAVMGLMFGAGQIDYAIGAALLLAVNIVCVNLSAKLVFLYKGIKPRTDTDQAKARKVMFFYIMFWAISLSVLAFIIYWKSK